MFSYAIDILFSLLETNRPMSVLEANEIIVGTEEQRENFPIDMERIVTQMSILVQRVLRRTAIEIAKEEQPDAKIVTAERRHVMQAVKNWEFLIY